MILLSDRTNPCPAHLGGHPTGLACTCTAGHTGGHVYHASDAPDRHDEGVSEQ